MKLDVLDKGFVDCLEVFGDDLTVVNAARVSFGKRKDIFDESDERLIRYLLKHKHYSPFRHVTFRFHIKAPEFVTRQMFRHVVGIETTSTYSTVDTAWNEISGRYVEVTEFYIPDVWRKQSDSNKQGSDPTTQLHPIKQGVSKTQYKDLLFEIERVYETMINNGVAKEQARIVLPLSQYTEFYWTASAQAVFNFLELRDEEHAQWEIREYAQAIRKIVEDKLPVTTKHWMTQGGEL